MARVDNILFCDGCGVEITWPPVVIAPGPEDGPNAREGVFCCQACAQGLKCSCANTMFEADDELR